MDTPWTQTKASIIRAMDTWATQSPSTLSVEQLEAIKTDAQAKQLNLTGYLKRQAAAYDVPSTLQEIGTLQQQLQALRKVKEETQVDVDTAIARDNLLRSRDTSGNAHTLYVLDHPIRRGFIPYMWVLSVLFVGVGVLFGYWMLPTLLPQGGQGFNTYGVVSTGSGVLAMVGDVFRHRMTWMALFGAALLDILFLSLRVAGIIGK